MDQYIFTIAMAFVMQASAAVAMAVAQQVILGVEASPISRRAIPSNVPSYVVDYAPIVYLYSSDPYRPASIGGQLNHTVPEVNYGPVSGVPSPLTLDNLDSLNDLGNTSVYLTATDYIDVYNNPSWTKGVTPDSLGQTEDAVSCAIIVNEHDSTHVDVFYMYFYAFDYGGTFLGTNLGNHVGDWEHNMIRFEKGKPTAIWYSQHSNGEAFTYAAVSKSGLRPIGYSANGSHANYAAPGTHDHTIPDLDLPQGLLQDHADAGAFWDPTLSAYYYSYDAATAEFTAYNDSTPTAWLDYNGQWGDEQYPDGDSRQLNYLGLNIEYRYASGPNGPKFKQLNRTEVCPANGNLCILRPFLTA